MAKKLIYGASIVTVEDSVTPEQGKAKMATFFPELANATFTVHPDTNDISYVVASGSKGAKKLIYGASIVTVEDAVTPEQGKAKMATFFPELANATWTVHPATNDISYVVASGSKGN